MNPITMQIVADKYIRMALEEDINSEDVSTNAVMPRYQLGTVDLICKQDGIIAGLDVFARAFQLLDEKIEIAFHAADGDAVKKGQLLATVTGDIRVLLSAERTALNYLQRMSGIATYTNAVAKLLAGTKTTLLDTRKTTPCMRVFEKYAVTVGGGSNHRYNLSDGVMLKDNHIGAAGGVKEAIAAAKAYAPFVRKIEVETETLDMVREAVEAGADIIMLPFFKKVTEVQRFLSIVDGRAKTCLLVETPEAALLIDEILELKGIDMIHLGLNDLHLALGMKFMFELLADGTVDRLSSKIKAKGIPFGFGGIATLTGGAMPGSMVLKEHYRLGSSMVIVSRSFCNTDITTNLNEVRTIFNESIADIRRLEEEAQEAATYFSNNRSAVIDSVNQIVENK